MGALLAGARPVWALPPRARGRRVLWSRTLRWRMLLRPLGDVPVLSARWSATVIGFGAGAVLPFRLGELVRPALVARKTGMKMSAALSSVVLERLFDMLIVLLCFLVVSFTQPVPPACGGARSSSPSGSWWPVVLLVVMQRIPPARSG